MSAHAPCHMEALPLGRQHTLPPRSLRKSPGQGHGLSPRKKGTHVARNVSGWQLEGPTAVIVSACPPDTWSSPPGHRRGTTHFHSTSAMGSRQLASVSEIWARVMLLLDKSWISWCTHGAWVRLVIHFRVNTFIVITYTTTFTRHLPLEDPGQRFHGLFMYCFFQPHINLQLSKLKFD